jgi:hypothetical protein
LQIEECVVQKSPLVALMLWQFAQAENHARKDAGCPPIVIPGGLQPVRWNILCDGFPELSQGRLVFRVPRVQTPESVGQLGK